MCSSLNGIWVPILLLFSYVWVVSSALYQCYFLFCSGMDRFISSVKYGWNGISIRHLQGWVDKADKLRVKGLLLHQVHGLKPISMKHSQKQKNQYYTSYLSYSKFSLNVTNTPLAPLSIPYIIIMLETVLAYCFLERKFVFPIPVQLRGLIW